MCSKPVVLRKVAYLDTGEALDTMSYLRRGYRPENLWAINRNPAEVAHLTRTLEAHGLPRINTVGLEFERALSERIPIVDVIDFDGMSQLHDKMVDMLGRIANQRKNIIFGVTLLGGREMGLEVGDVTGFHVKHVTENRIGSKVTTSFNRLVNPAHAARVETLLSYAFTSQPNSEERFAEFERWEETINRELPDVAERMRNSNRRDTSRRPFEDMLYEVWGRTMCSIHVERLLWDVYMSTSRQPMVWVVFKTTLHTWMTRKETAHQNHKTRGLAIPACCEKPRPIRCEPYEVPLLQKFMKLLFRLQAEYRKETTGVYEIVRRPAVVYNK
jgi:hypothetical protein